MAGQVAINVLVLDEAAGIQYGSTAFSLTVLNNPDNCDENRSPPSITFEAVLGEINNIQLSGIENGECEYEILELKAQDPSTQTALQDHFQIVQQPVLTL